MKQAQERRRLGRMQPPPAAPVGAPQSSAVPGQAPSTTPTQTSQVPAKAPSGATQPAIKPVSTAVAKQAPAAVKSVLIVQEKTGPAIEILTSRPIPPALQTLSNPPRLLIDLPNANVAVKQKHLSAPGEQFTNVRVDQYQVTPPVTRVVVDLIAPRQYTWDAAGNRLMIRLKPTEEAKPKSAAAPGPQPTTVTTFGAGAQPAVVPVTPRPSGSMVLAGSRIGSGSSVTASEETAVLHIARGGEVHVCPRTTVSVTASKNGQELMLGMSSGALETHYHLEATADAVLTPDFRILLSGPGDFDYAIATNSHGDTCVRALLGNTASVLVSELMGDRTYQVKPTEQVVFQDGRVDRVSNDLPVDCGCAAPPLPIMRASSAPPTTVLGANVPSNVHLQTSPVTRAALDPMLPPLPAPATRAVLDPMLPPLPSHTNHPPSQGALASANPSSAHLPTSKPEDIHVQVEAPFVFRRPDPAQGQVQQTTRSLTTRPPSTSARLDPTAPLPTEMPPPKLPEAAPEQPKKKAERHGFFGKMKGMFSAIFR
jgi:hypothetical protein